MVEWECYDCGHVADEDDFVNNGGACPECGSSGCGEVEYAIECDNCGWQGDDADYDECCPKCGGPVTEDYRNETETTIMCQDDACGWSGPWAAIESIEICPDCGEGV